MHRMQCRHDAAYTECQGSSRASGDVSHTGKETFMATEFFPRGGDVSAFMLPREASYLFFPRARGCFHYRSNVKYHVCVFPA